MTAIVVISDVHLGVHRQAGTTPLTQAAVKKYVQDMFEAMITNCHADKLVINGDLFDEFSVDPGEVISAYSVLSKFIENGGSVVLCMGNHDWSAKGTRTSSFHLLAHFMESRFPQSVQAVTHESGLIQIDQQLNAWAIPHMPNQALFDLEIERAASLAIGVGYLFLHCNVMSPFAEHSDHSLNLSETQVEALVNAGWTIVVGHEHQARYVHGKRVIVTGNQIPTSVADCLNNPANKKQRMRITDEGWVMEDALDLDPLFIDVSWTDIGTADLDGYQFIRVSGDCSADQAAVMVNAIAKLRQAHPAFVITNAVKVEGVAQMEGLAQMSLDQVSSFDVLGALLGELDEKEQKTVKELLSA